MTVPQIQKKIAVNRAADLLENTTQTLNARRVSGVSKENSDVESLWLGKVYTGPGEVSDPHHHGEVETAGYVFEGDAYIRYGERFENIVYMTAGDYIYVPPGIPHIEGNRSLSKELVWMTARALDNVVVNLKDQDIANIEIEMIP